MKHHILATAILTVAAFLLVTELSHADHGGPDEGGYYFIDNDDQAANRPVYEWIDISGIGDSVSFLFGDQDEGMSNSIPMDMSYEFYGITFYEIYVSSNGWISFFPESDPARYNYPIPVNSSPNALIAVEWDDLDGGDEGVCYTYHDPDNNRFIVSWVDWKHSPYINSPLHSFQVILNGNDNSIVMQYGPGVAYQPDISIGLENFDGNIGTEYTYNNAELYEGKAIYFGLEPPVYDGYEVLLASAAGPEPEDFIDELMAFDDIGRVDWLRAGTYVPDLSFLAIYDVVVIWSVFHFFYPDSLGDVLADYVDNGGAVVMMMCCFIDDWGGVEGRIMTDYSPFNVGVVCYDNLTLGEYDRGHQVMNQVDSLATNFSLNVSLRDGSYLVASWGNNIPLMAYNPEVRVSAINVPLDMPYYEVYGDLTRLIHNAIDNTIRIEAPVMLIHSDITPHPYRDDLAGQDDIGFVHYYKAGDATPTLDLLTNYEAVVVWSQEQFANSDGLGNVLADYLENGGGIVLHQSCFNSETGYGLEGRLMTEYSPLSTGLIHEPVRYLGNYNPDHPLMAEVTTAGDSMTSDVALTNSGDVVASYEDGIPLAAVNPDFNLVALNGNINYQWPFIGDMQRLSFNAVNYVLGLPTEIQDEIILPSVFSLSQNYPNPFNAGTTISYTLSKPSDVVLEVYDILGRCAETLVEQRQPAGSHQVIWDANDYSSGIYFYRLSAGEMTSAKKMVLLK